MPTDFVARWLQYLGRSALLASKLEEPEGKDQEFYLITLGMASVGGILLSILALFTAAPDSVDNVVHWIAGVKETKALFGALGDALIVVLLILSVPQVVGSLYGRYVTSKLYRSISMVLFVLVGMVAGFYPRLLALVILTFMGVLVGMCPKVPITGVRENARKVS